MKKGHQSTGKTKPLSKSEVKKNPDKHIDQDFPGYPNSPANEDTIDPRTAEDKVNANLYKKNKTPKKKQSTDEQSSDGSANAFEATENDEVLREELNDDDQKESNY